MSRMTKEELDGHVAYFKNSPETLRMMANSHLARSVGIDPNDTETLQMLTELVIRKMTMWGKFDHP